MLLRPLRDDADDAVAAHRVTESAFLPLEAAGAGKPGSDGGAWAQDPETNSATAFVPQGIGADLIATLEGFSREDVDAFAMESQRRAARARDVRGRTRRGGSG